MMFWPAQLSSKEALDMRERAKGPVDMPELTKYCMPYNTGNMCLITEFGIAADSVPKDYSEDMKQVLVEWSQRLKKFPVKCAPIKKIKLIDRKRMEVDLYRLQCDKSQIVNTGPIPCKPGQDVYVYPPIWTNNFNPTVVNVNCVSFVPNMILNDTEHKNFIDHELEPDTGHVKSFIDRNFYQFDHDNTILPFCRSAAKRLRPMGRIECKSVTNTPYSNTQNDQLIITNEECIIRLY